MHGQNHIKLVAGIVVSVSVCAGGIQFDTFALKS